VKSRLDPDVLAALRATGDARQTRINDMLRASLTLAGRIKQLVRASTASSARSRPASGKWCVADVTGRCG
jgi:hypothetical protein